MGSFGRIAIGARGQLSYAEELDALGWGEPIPPTQRVDFLTESFNNEIGNLLSEALNPSRGISKRVRGVSNISGDVAVEQNTTGYETWYKHAFGDSVTINKCDGGVRTQVTADYSGGAGDISVGDTSAFDDGAGDWDLVAVYKDSTTGLLTTQALEYSAKAASPATFTLTGSPTAIPQGAWIMQTYGGGSAYWDSVYTHYIEAAAVLPTGMTFEVGRDVAFFVYSGCKFNTVENTFTAQEILQATFGTIGRAEYSGADLLVATTDTTTELELKNYYLDYYNASGAIGYAFADDGGVFTDETSAANDDTADDVTLLPAAVAANDAFYFGSDDVFTALEVIISTPAATPVGWTVDWEYYDGSAWTTLPFLVQELETLEEAAGTYVNTWNAPADWTATTVNAQSAYWVRANLSAATSGAGPLAQRVYTGPGIVGFGKSGTIQVGSENEITYSGTEVSITAGTAKLLTVSNWASGSTHAIDEPVAPQVTWGSDVAEPTATDPLSSFQAAVYIDGVAQEVLSATWTLNNNLFTDKYQLGDRFRAGLPEQQRTVEGSLNVEFDDMILYHKYVNGTAAFLEIRCVDDGYQIDDSAPAGFEVYGQKHCILPNIEYTGTTPQIGGPDQITHDMPFTALIDSTNDMNEIAVIFVNDRATI